MITIVKKLNLVRAHREGRLRRPGEAGGCEPAARYRRRKEEGWPSRRGRGRLPGAGEQICRRFVKRAVGGGGGIIKSIASIDQIVRIFPEEGRV